ncbi:glycosyltransferase family 2 protein [Ovoidimarina sediminis]|uniref:glycosyltransferase family 2 protein n=1 Tax=Ovoidimarina sediminis TaxID=3079856 RepID=UPI002909883C|nr:glycosyltransferase [Rhodophyticola sp. MJ-SS7]MDU8946143.1 glycosyltransferase [Rhodophyticola sp. MJ-SS7]
MTALLQPSVSVIIPVYNSSQFLQDAIESVLSQTGVDVELIAVDDGSNDGSQRILASYSQVKLVEQEHKGACSARNHGIEKATGEYVKFLDSDDFLEPEILEKQVRFMANAHSNVIVYSDTLFFDDETGRTNLHVTNLMEDDDQVVQLFKSNIHTPAPLHRRTSLMVMGGFDERLTKAQEYNLHLRLAMAGYRFQRLPGIGTHVREHTSPHRITSQHDGRRADENAVLRGKIYTELLHDHYGKELPSALLRLFCSSSAEAALVQVRRGNFCEAWKALNSLRLFEPSAFDFFAGVADALLRAARYKFRSLRARLGRSHR